MDTERKNKRPRTYMSRNNRRAMIIKSSWPVFAQKGYHGATITDICKASSIAQGTLYLHFKNKQEIFQGILLEIQKNLRKIMEPMGVVESGNINTENDALDYLRNKVSRIFSLISKNRDLLLIIFREAPGLNEEIDRNLVQIKNSMLAQIETEQILFQRLGFVRRVDPRLASQMILGIMVMIIMDNVFERDAPDTEMLANRVCDLIFYGIVPDK